MKNRLTTIRIKSAGDGKLFDGGGLMLIKKGNAGKWVYRYSHLGKRREMGLGSWPVVSLKDARQKRDNWARVLGDEKDPIAVRDAQRADFIAQRDRKDPTFAELVDLVFEKLRAVLRDDGAGSPWKRPLELYMIPVIGKKPGSKLAWQNIEDALRPIWRTKHPTAMKVLQKTRIVLKEAELLGFPVEPDIADTAEARLGLVNHVTEHAPYVPWKEVPALYASLPDTSAGWCNRWCILTAVRLLPAREAMVSEVNDNVWTVPAARMKGRLGRVKDFRVPLSEPALQIVERAREFEMDFLFPGRKAGKGLSASAVEKCLKRMGAVTTPHGFRTSFYTWGQETGSMSPEVAEMALSHVGDRRRRPRAYARAEYMDLRRPAMEAWARFVTGTG